MAGRMLWAVVFAVSAATVCGSGASAGEDDFGVRNLYITCDRWPDHSSLKNFYTDICEIDDAQTDQQKAVTLLRWLRRTIKSGRRPDIDVKGFNRTLAVLNVFGTTDSDELCEIATQIWRVAEGKPAYKIYLPKYDHTAVHLWYMDDKERRWHWFDYANGTYLYARPPRRLAGANDLITDPSLYLIPSKGPVPAVDRHDTRGWTRRDGRDVRSLYKARAPGINLRPGQTLNRWWMNPREFKPGQVYSYLDWLVSNKLGDDSDLVKTLKQADDPAGLAEPTLPNVTLEGGRIKGVGPYDDFDGHGVIYGGLLSTEIVSTGPGTVTLFLAVDNGDNRELKKVNLNGPTKKRINILLGRRAKGNDVAAAVFGSRKFAVSYKTAPVTPEDDLDVTAVDAMVMVRQNQAALPALRAGRNRITVSGEIASKCGLRITYVWDDEDGLKRKHTAAIRSLPYKYTIITSASDNRNVICRKLISECVYPPTVTRNKIISAPFAREKILKRDRLREDESASAEPTPKMKTQEQYIKDLKPRDMQDMWTKLHAARILAGIADEKSFDELVPYLKDGTIPLKKKDREYGTVRSWIAAAIARTKHESAADALLSMFKKGPSLGSDAGDPNSWDLWAAIIALGKLGDEKAVEPLIDRYTFSRGPTKWTILQALTMLRDKRALELMQGELLGSDIDVGNVAAAGLLAMPDKESLGPLFKAGKYREDQALRICAAKLAGRFKAKEYQVQLRKYLESDSLEEVRGWSAWSLGEMEQDYGANLSALEASMATEMSPWVLEKIEAALDKIKRKAYIIR